MHSRVLFPVQLVCTIVVFFYFQQIGIIRCSKVDDVVDEIKLNHHCLHGRLFKQTWNNSVLQKMGDEKSEDFG